MKIELGYLVCVSPKLQADSMYPTRKAGEVLLTVPG